MTDTCVQIVDGKRGGRNSNVLLNGHLEFLVASVH